MKPLAVTDHAAIRMAQRGISLKDSDLITLIGTEVDDGYLVTAHDSQRVEHELKRLMDRIRRIRGKRLVVVNGQILTAYHASRRKERRLLRHANENDRRE
jgi:hypothetical protein